MSKAEAKAKLAQLAAALRGLDGKAKLLKLPPPVQFEWAAKAIESYLAPGNKKSLDHSFGLVTPVGRKRKAWHELSGAEKKNYEIAKQIFWLECKGGTFGEDGTIVAHFDPYGEEPDSK